MQRVEVPPRHDDAMATDAPRPDVLLGRCCECGVGLDVSVNPTSTCVNCLRARIDITEGICTSTNLFKCRRCLRYCAGPTTYVEAELESRELMALCLKRVKGLKRVKVADAAWIWTEPHSMRLKVELTVQKEVDNGAIMQQPLLCEFVVRNQQCGDCQAAFASMAWTASVQVRQRVDHKRTFFYLEQVILKKHAQAAAVKIEQFRDGLDFFFKAKNDAVRFVNFLNDCVPTKVKDTKKLVSADTHSNLFNHQYTSLVELAPACKDDLVLLDARTAARLGSLPRVVLVRSVNAVVRLVDPRTAQLAELGADAYWRSPPRVLVSAGQLEAFVVLDSDRVAPVMGYDLRATNLPGECNADLESLGAPDVVLVRKAPQSMQDDEDGEAAGAKKRAWRLDNLDVDETHDDDERTFAAEMRERDLEIFRQQLETDRDMRGRVNLYKDPSGVLDDAPAEDPDAIKLDELLDAVHLDATPADAVEDAVDDADLAAL
ncbi:amine dehydrogenase [Aureococcus anophagefferens]|nr:amine dehydrogenase [Aureococcus anophagefferens]